MKSVVCGGRWSDEALYLLLKCDVALFICLISGYLLLIHAFYLRV